jgi:WhiB family redox-sensing transcriptional regulator
MANGQVDRSGAAAYPEFRDGTEACATQDPDAFFRHNSRAEAKPAKDVCRECRLRDECLDWALATDQRYGIWGATTPPERNKIMRERGLR